MWPNPQDSADLVTFSEEILNGKLFFFFFFLQCKNERLIYRKKFNDITSRYDFIIFDFIIISAMKFTYTVCSQSKYIQNQVV